ncbi:hypothetical protein ACH3XX_20150 [Streptomyces scabiei]|uniref:hypothetical protein n=1 Tax=Streptomyces scabiei TaxID=1930 RepID=UPI0037B2609D
MVQTIPYGPDSHRILTELARLVRLAAQQDPRTLSDTAGISALAMARHLISESEDLGACVVWPATHCIDWLNRTGRKAAEQYRSRGGVGDFGAVVLAEGIALGFLTVTTAGLIDVTGRGEAEARSLFSRPARRTVVDEQPADPFAA